ncbi:MAG: hypothetical protein JXL67_12545, partial [Calditrichaeota bacterium]|nr:hypothetical protein [Calditrichota bacterium]
DAGGNSGYREEKKSETSPATEESEKPSFYEQSTDLFEKKAVKPEKPANQAEVKQAVPAKKPVPKDDNHRDKRPKQAPLNLAYLPLQEKIRKIVAKFPLISVRQLKKMLKHEDFGRERVNYIRLYRVLRELNLDTRAKRYRYYRSC